jgi:uncharacterized membrane protein YhaH (DUF805 family)
MRGAFIAHLGPKISGGVKRLHDFGLSGWWYIVLLPAGVGSWLVLPGSYVSHVPDAVPLTSLAVIVLFGCLRGTRGPNRFGPDPVG